MNALPAFFHHVDVHTHVDAPGASAIVSISPGDEFGQSSFYSVGIHPWDADSATPETFRRLREMAADPRVVAVGEAGLDALRGPSPDIQERVFVEQARLADALGKPLVVHCVRRFNRIVELRMSLRPSVPWIIHGFRGKPALARDLVRHGFYLSVPEERAASLRDVVGPAFVLRETDAVPPRPLTFPSPLHLQLGNRKYPAENSNIQ